MYRKSRMMSGLRGWGGNRKASLGDTAIVLANGMRVSGPSPTMLNNRLELPNRINRIASAPNSYPDGALIEGSGPAVYVMQGGRRRWIPDPATFAAMGYVMSMVQRVSDAAMNAIPLGAPIPAGTSGPPTFSSGVRSGNGRVQSSSQSLNLAQLQSIAQTNPSSLTPSQWSTLQAAGTIPSTLPYGSASLLSTSSPIAATDTSLATVSASGLSGISDTLNTTYGPLPLWGWAAVAAGAYFFMGRHGRR